MTKTVGATLECHSCADEYPGKPEDPFLATVTAAVTAGWRAVTKRKKPTVYLCPDCTKEGVKV